MTGPQGLFWVGYRTKGYSKLLLPGGPDHGNNNAAERSYSARRCSFGRPQLVASFVPGKLWHFANWALFGPRAMSNLRPQCVVAPVGPTCRVDRTPERSHDERCV